MTIPAEKVIERAKASGFDAELAVAAILRRRHWGATSNVYYIDADENISRELDILGHKPFNDASHKQGIYCWLYICAEVKRTSEPFIFFTDERQPTDFGLGYGLLHTKHGVNHNLLPYEELNRLCPVSGPKRLARSYISFKDGKAQQVKSGIISAFKGAMYHAEKGESRYSDLSLDINFYLPILVVDGPLWEAYFADDSGELVAEEVEELIYLQSYLSPAYDSVEVRVVVVTLKALPALLQRMEDWGASIRDTLLKNS